MVTDLHNPRLDREHPPRSRLRRATGSVLPTLATLGNLICGFAAIYYSTKGNFATAAWLIFSAMLFDALDGRLARLARTTSDFGAQLDSLADVVSFGAAPAVLMLMLLAQRIGGHWFHDQWLGSESAAGIVGRSIFVIAAIFVACAALRLARFNVETTADESAHMWFKGLPTPAAAAALVSLVLLMEGLVNHDRASWTVRMVFWVLPPVSLAAALMMVSSVPYPHLFNHLVRGRRPFGTLVVAVIVVALLLVGRELSLAIGSVGYALSGPTLTLYRRLWRKDFRSPDELASDVVERDDDD